MTYNQTAPAEVQVKTGDFVVAVNGIKGDTSKMARQVMQDSLELDFTFSRPLSYSVTLEKGTVRMLGLDIDYLATGRSLLIRDIKDGLVQRWNTANPTKEIKRGDRIVGVNGIRDKAETLMDHCADTDKLVLDMVRP